MKLNNQHGVAVAVKTVFIFNRDFIRLINIFPAGEGADKH